LFIDRLCDDVKGDRLLAMHQVADMEVGPRHIVAWTDGELLIWISDNRAYHALGDLGKAFERDVGAPVKVETQEQINKR
jgi:hypothetical protein